MSFYEVPLSVQKDLDDMCEELNRITDTHEVEVRGYWIWIGNSDVSYDSEYENLGFRWSARTEKWYWPHPRAPKKGRRGGLKKRVKRKATSKRSTPKRELTEREKLEAELKGIRELFQIDSGENWINIKKMEVDVLAKLKVLDNN